MSGFVLFCCAAARGRVRDGAVAQASDARTTQNVLNRNTTTVYVCVLCMQISLQSERLCCAAARGRACSRRSGCRGGVLANDAQRACTDAPGTRHKVVYLL